MADLTFGEDRAVIFFDGDGPVPLEDMTSSFAALARIYSHHFDAGGASPKLYVSKLKSGSIEAEIVPLLMVLGAAVPYMDGAIVVRDFTKWIGIHVKSLAQMGESAPPPALQKADASDLKEFLKPISGRRGAQLGVTHARFSEKTGDREVVAEYAFEEAAINRAAVNLERHREAIEDKRAEDPPRLHEEFLMVWHQASREPGKEAGRTGDRAIIEAISDKPLTVYFPKQTNDLKRRMTQDEPYPSRKGYIVDVFVDYVKGAPKLYRVTELHDVIDLEP